MTADQLVSACFAIALPPPVALLCKPKPATAQLTAATSVPASACTRASAPTATASLQLSLVTPSRHVSLQHVIGHCPCVGSSYTHHCSDSSVCLDAGSGHQLWRPLRGHGPQHPFLWPEQCMSEPITLACPSTSSFTCTSPSTLLAKSALQKSAAVHAMRYHMPVLL